MSFIIFSDSTDIVDQRLKLILGLIWTLILHYSISLPMWEGEEELPQVRTLWLKVNEWLPFTNSSVLFSFVAS